ncbi:MAG: hypothetical protein H6Q14_918 [Bacteroidetes bacterium]|nr:hypothetical protein [Bacteroidota bacterium]
MKAPVVLFFSIICSLASCVNSHKEHDARFTKEQVKSLDLEGTTVLDININEVKVLNLNPFLKKQDFDFGSMVDSVKLLPLETTKESLISNIRKILVADSNVYIIDEFKGGSIVIFDRNGKFVKRIIKGQAPEEIFQPNDMAFDKRKGELVVYHKYFLSFFTPSGQYKSRTKVPFASYNFTILPNGYLFQSINGQGNSHFDLPKEYLTLVVDNNFKLKSVAIPYFYSNNVNYGNGLGYLYADNGVANITKPYTDTIYQYEYASNRLNAKYALDISRKKLPDKYLMGDWGDFEKALQQNDYFLYNGKYLETKNQNVFFVENWHIKSWGIIFRDKNSGNMKGGTNMVFNTNQIPPISFPISTYKQYFISTYLPDSKLDLSSNSNLSQEDKIKIKNLTEDDNPVLVFYELKPF